MVLTGDNGEQVVMTQSLAIIEYLDEKFEGPKLLPSDPSKRYKVRELAQIIATGIQPVQNLSVLKKVVAWTGEKDNKLKWGKETIDAGFQETCVLIYVLIEHSVPTNRLCSNKRPAILNIL